MIAAGISAFYEPRAFSAVIVASACLIVAMMGYFAERIIEAIRKSGPPDSDQDRQK